MAEDEFRIDPTKRFHRLEHAPIVEAAVEIRCSSAGQWDEQSIKSRIEKMLDGYQFLDSQSEYKAKVDLDTGSTSTEPPTKVRWKGARYQSEDGRYVAAFNFDSFLLSRLAPYEAWEPFENEVLRAWKLHVEMARPSEIQRVGLRFINLISLPSGSVSLDEYIDQSPVPPRDMNLPIVSFLHRETLRVPDSHYFINITRAPKARISQGKNEYAVVLDIDVYTDKVPAVDESVIKERLADMRFLKNTAFLGSIAKGYEERLRGESR